MSSRKLCLRTQRRGCRGLGKESWLEVQSRRGWAEGSDGELESTSGV